MGYSKSKKAVFKVKYYLDKLVEADINVAFGTNHPKTLAYNIHNGIHAAQYYPDAKRYHDLRNKFEITFSGNQVKCTLKERMDFDEPKPTDIINVDSVTDALGVISAVIKYKASVIHFPDYDQESSTEIIENWCSANGYNLERGENGITLIREGLDYGTIKLPTSHSAT